MDKEQILEAISETGWGTDILGLPSPHKIVSPEKLAAFLEKIVNKPA